MPHSQKRYKVPGCEISSLLDKKICERISCLLCFGVGMSAFCLTKQKRYRRIRDLMCLQKHERSLLGIKGHPTTNAKATKVRWVSSFGVWANKDYHGSLQLSFCINTKFKVYHLGMIISRSNVQYNDNSALIKLVLLLSSIGFKCCCMFNIVNTMYM